MAHCDAGYTWERPSNQALLKLLSAEASPIDFDVITEFWFEDRAPYDSFVARTEEPDIADQIAKDEENLFVRSAIRMFVVDEMGDEISV